MKTWLKKNWKQAVVTLIVIVLAYIVGHANGNPNAELQYGDTGAPANCRAIVHENYESFVLDDISAEDALESINRNCGRTGHSWE